MTDQPTVPDEWLQAAFDAIGRSNGADGDDQVRAILAAVLPLHREWLAGHFDDISASRARASQQTEGYSQAMAHIQADAYHTAAWLVRNPDQFRAPEPEVARPDETTQENA